jgi:hypothetical protein
MVVLGSGEKARKGVGGGGGNLYRHGTCSSACILI